MHILKINEVFKFLFSLLNYSCEFKIPYKKKILLYNRPSEIVLNFGVNKNNACVFDKKKINLYILFSTILKGNFSSTSYIHNYIKHINPKIVINYCDNDINFYLLKKFFPKITFIAIQNGLRLKREQFYNDLKKKTNLHIDYYFLLNKFFSNKLKKYIKFKPIISGSLKNNSVNFRNNKIKKKTMLFISQLNHKTINDQKDFWKKEKKILPIIEEFCNKNNFKLDILARGKNKNEENFYKSILSKKFKYIKPKKLSENSYMNSYKKLDLYQNILFIESTLGYEALVRKKKVIVFPGRYSGKGIKNYFGWPKKINREGSFYTNKNSKEAIFLLLKRNLKIPYMKWYKKNRNVIKDLFIYDRNNNKFLNLIKFCLSK